MEISYQIVSKLARIPTKIAELLNILIILVTIFKIIN